MRKQGTKILTSFSVDVGQTYTGWACKVTLICLLDMKAKFLHVICFKTFKDYAAHVDGSVSDSFKWSGKL